MRCRASASEELANEMNMHTEWIFFDLGWVLVDETQAHRKRLEVVRDHLDSDVSVDDLWQLCVQASTDFFPSPFLGMLGCLGIDQEQHDRIVSAARYDHKHEILYACVPELLARLREKFNLGVIANQSKGTEERLSRWGIRQHFSLVFASAEFGLSKPDPQIFAAALSQAKCDPEDALMVGDRLDNDIGPAKAQRWRTMRVLQGFSRFQEPRHLGESADVILNTIEDLAANQNLGGIVADRAEPSS
jgi:HAD superfamily hydrolase (TIGR01549 family)